MKRCPHAKWDPLSSTQTQPAMKAHNVVCLHTMVGTLAGTDDMFEGGGYKGTESTYGIGGKWGRDATEKLDGVALQWQDRRYTADANLEGTPYTISLETADNYPAKAADIQRWTPKQAATIVDIVAWECSLEAHSECPSSWTCRKGVMWKGIRVAIPPVLIPDTKPGRRGIGYHRQGVDPWRVSGGDVWSTAYGKECPGPVRIKQLETEIIPAVQARILGEDMPITKADAELIADTLIKRDQITAPKRETNPENTTWAPQSFWRITLNAVDDVSAEVASTKAAVAALQSEVSDLRTGFVGFDLDAAVAAIDAAGDRAAAKVTQAAESALAQFDAIRVDVNRGE